MARKIIDIGSRLQSAFGYSSTNMSEDLQKSGFKASIASADVFITAGNTSFEEMVLRGNGIELKFAFTDQIGAGINNVFAPPPMITFNKEKRIESTILDGADGEAVEKYGHKPREFTIQGLLIDMENRRYPGQKVRQLVEMFDYDGIWNVESQIMQDHKIKSIYFESMDDAGVPNFPDTWSYTLKGYSIKPVEFILNKK